MNKLVEFVTKLNQFALISLPNIIKTIFTFFSSQLNKIILRWEDLESELLVNLPFHVGIKRNIYKQIILPSNKYYKQINIKEYNSLSTKINESINDKCLMKQSKYNNLSKTPSLLLGKLTSELKILIYIKIYKKHLLQKIKKHENSNEY